MLFQVLQLVVGDLSLSIQCDDQASRTGISEATILDGDAALENRPKDCVEIQTFLHRR